MNTRAFLIFTALLGLANGFGTTGCGPTCPGNQPNCGTSNGSTAGAAGTTSSASATCDALTTLKGCMDAFCASTTNPFCYCYTKGYDLDTLHCPNCITFSPKKFCDEQAASGVTFDCSSATSSVATTCVGVQ